MGSNQQTALLALKEAREARAAAEALGLVAFLATSVEITQTTFAAAQGVVSIDLAELAGGVGVWEVEESWIVSGAILSTFRSKLTIGPDADPLANNAGMFQSIPAAINDAVIFQRSTRVMIRPEGGGFLVSVSGTFGHPDAQTVNPGETGPDDTVQDQVFTIPGDLVIGTVSRFDAGGSEVTLQQFMISRIA